MKSLRERLAVCSWSLQPKNPAELMAAMDQIGLKRIQIALDPFRTEPEVWNPLAEQCQQRGFSFASGMFGTIGEDYTTLETIRLTGGVVPDATWEQNWSHIQQVVKIAAKLGLKLVTFHSGFLPHDQHDPNFQKLLERITRIADLFAASGIDLGFETGQEDAETLKSFLTTLNRANVGVNFDPANMILYDKGDPIVALRTLAPWLKQCHIKDAIRTQITGTWGQEVQTGTGQVDWRKFLQTLSEIGFTGDLCIEREAGDQRIIDIRAAQTYLQSL